MSVINLSELYEKMQKEILHQLRDGASAFIHSGTKGNNTEVNWINWFRAYQPKRYNVDKGIIIESTGKQSHQIDLIIYDVQYSYLVFHQGNSILIPAESVYAVFEAKQELNKANIEYAGKKAKSVRDLVRTSAPIRHAGGSYPPKALHEIIAGILTIRSSWADPTISNVVLYINNQKKE